MGDHLVKHGDGVKDIAFTVQDCDFLVQVMLQAFIQINISTYIMHLPYTLLHRKPESEVQLL